MSEQPKSEQIVWRRVNLDPFEYAIQQGLHGDEFVKLLDGSSLRRPWLEEVAPLPGTLGDFIDREERYLLSHFTADCDIMPGDVEGSFHRIREILAIIPLADLCTCSQKAK